MKKHHVYQKNIRREITGSLGRFLSILAIVALGTGFLAGLSATSPDMIDSVDQYYDENAMMDLQILSEMGLTEEDAQAIAEIDGIAEVMAGYRTDVMMDCPNEETLAARLQSIPEEGSPWLNRVTLLEGRMPAAANECVAVKLKNSSVVPEVGDTLQVNGETDTSDTLANRIFTVTCIVDSAYYFSTAKESTSLGSGTIGMVLLLPESAFTMDSYGEIFALVEGAADLNSFDEDYLALLDAAAERVEAIADERCEIRYHALTDEPAQELEEGWEAFYSQQADAEAQLQDGAKTLADSRDSIDAAWAALEAAGETLRAAGYTEEMITAALAEDTAQAEAAEAAYEEALADYEQSKADSEEALAEAEQELLDAQAALDEIQVPEWYVNTREDNLSYASFDGNSMKVAAIATVFPVFFFLVAALVSLTTMTRMVEEQRVQIGTLKALGYSNTAIAMKYVLYAGAAAVIGSIVGLTIGFRLFPCVIWNAYGIMYHLPRLYTPFRWSHALMAFLGTFLAIMAAVLGACRHSLKECAAGLMLPKAPKAGKRVLLEHITPLWKRLRFTHKVTVRNLFRYKKRFFMTIIGVAGCTALLLAGFGLSDSINDILDKQYGELNHYEMMVICKEGSAAEDAEVLAVLQDTEGFMAVHQESCDAAAGDRTTEVSLFVPKDTARFPDMVTIRERKSGKGLTLSEDSVILTEKAAETLGISAGGTMTLETRDGEQVTVTVGGITENYVGGYVYMTPQQYQLLFGKEAEASLLLVRAPELDEDGLNALASQLLECENISMISKVSDTRTTFRNMLSSIDYIVVVLIVCAGLLAFVVLYNLMNINITERQRELATLKVLGFFDGEVGAYVYRETMILALLGTAAGLVVGIFLHAFVIRTAEVDAAMFGREIAPSSFVYAAALTVLFSLLVCLAMYPKLRNINMVESLKSVD